MMNTSKSLTESVVNELYIKAAVRKHIFADCFTDVSLREKVEK